MVRYLKISSARFLVLYVSSNVSLSACNSITYRPIVENASLNNVRLINQNLDTLF